MTVFDKYFKPGRRFSKYMNYAMVFTQSNFSIHKCANNNSVPRNEQSVVSSNRVKHILYTQVTLWSGKLILNSKLACGN